MILLSILSTVLFLFGMMYVGLIVIAPEFIERISPPPIAWVILGIIIVFVNLWGIVDYVMAYVLK